MRDPLVCVVQGASRGIGLELSRQLARRGEVVFATCRRPEEAEALGSLRERWPERVVVLRLDARDPGSVEAAAQAVGAAGGRVDLLLNTAGVLQDEALGIVPERALARVEAQAVAASFATNALGPLLVARAFAPLLRSAARQRRAACGARAVFYSARVGSIGDNASGGWYAYRGSKAALNQFVRCLSHELGRQGVCCVSLHPGTVDTDLTRAFSRARAKYAVHTVEAAVARHLEIVDSLTMEDNGTFLDWKRTHVPW